MTLHGAGWVRNGLMIACTVLIVIVMGGSLMSRVPESLGTVLTYGITALVILWYTRETAAIRAQGDEEARLRRTPLLNFQVLAPDGENPELSIRFVVANTSDRVAIIRPKIRLKSPDSRTGFDEGVYGGQEDWVIWAHDTWSGHFELAGLVDTKKVVRMSEVWKAGPFEDCALDVQVPVYNARGEFLYLYRREYYLKMKFRKEIAELWPQVTPRTFGVAEFASRIATKAGEGLENLL